MEPDRPEPERPEPEPKTSDFYRTEPNLPERFNRPSRMLGYRTTNQSYGNSAPTVHHMPTCFAALSSRFSREKFHGGMFIDSGFNTTLDKSRVSTATARPKGHAHHLHLTGEQGQ
ncbi:piercer of microtubule wall 1 protein isoform X2 [Boleophthalmus pectinirostris]|uniref:piercer of microtubule wall 1 protein isoform X2 n=1 Tax=Boleophthalmus pectinirostris TaxID=150288 RepID=UPI00242EA939|nr:piercer of microtubule wall 1 protein isoform X2 [Boleophthalmus pectinirostris]